MEPIYMLWLREVKRYTRSRPQILASLGQPLLYLLALGFGLGATYQKANGGSYLQFISPGIIGMAVLFSSVFSGIALLWDRQFGFLKETLVAPVPRLEIMIGRTLGSATTSMIQGLLVSIVCLIAGFRPDQPRADSGRAILFAADRDFIRRAGNDDRFGHPRHAGVSDRDELPRAPDFLPIGSAIPAGYSSQERSRSFQRSIRFPMVSMECAEPWLATRTTAH